MSLPFHIYQHIIAYVASIWNSYRKACLLDMNGIISCHRRISSYPDGLEINALIHEVVALAEAIVVSHPLVSDRPVGGLLSVHTFDTTNHRS